MSWNYLWSINHKQDRSVTTCSNDEINHKILFLFACQSNVDFFLYWYEDKQIHYHYSDWSSYNTQIMINQINIKYQILTLLFFLRISVIICWQIFFVISHVFHIIKSFIHNCWMFQFWFWFSNHLYIICLFVL